MPYKDKDKLRAYQNQWCKNRRLQWIATQGGKCVRCGSKDALEVDHKDRSEKVSHRIWSWSKARRNEELQKCQVLCMPCHLDKTVSENQTDEHGSAMYKRGCRCDICRQSHMLNMRAWREAKRLREVADTLALV